VEGKIEIPSLSAGISFKERQKRVEEHFASTADNDGDRIVQTGFTVQQHLDVCPHVSVP
jgi:hypothetical protein